jgi:hypothetical protein
MQIKCDKVIEVVKYKVELELSKEELQMLRDICSLTVTIPAQFDDEPSCRNFLKQIHEALARPNNPALA